MNLQTGRLKMIEPGEYKNVGMDFNSQSATVIQSSENGAIGWIHFKNLGSYWPQAWSEEGHAMDELRDEDEYGNRDTDFDLDLQTGKMKEA